MKTTTDILNKIQRRSSEKEIPKDPIPIRLSNSTRESYSNREKIPKKSNEAATTTKLSKTTSKLQIRQIHQRLSASAIATSNIQRRPSAPPLKVNRPKKPQRSNETGEITAARSPYSSPNRSIQTVKKVNLDRLASTSPQLLEKIPKKRKFSEPPAFPSLENAAQSKKSKLQSSTDIPDSDTNIEPVTTERNPKTSRLVDRIAHHVIKECSQISDINKRNNKVSSLRNQWKRQLGDLTDEKWKDLWKQVRFKYNTATKPQEEQKKVGEAEKKQEKETKHSTEVLPPTERKSDGNKTVSVQSNNQSSEGVSKDTPILLDDEDDDDDEEARYGKSQWSNLLIHANFDGTKYEIGDWDTFEPLI